MTLGKTKYLIVVAGPTAVGKTKLAIELAKYYKTEILSTDSRQFYKEMSIGTAKPTQEEQEEVAHHMIDFLSIHQNYNVKQFEEDALQILEHIFSKKNIAIATGGSGLYIKTLCEGIDEMPEISTETRNKWQKKLQEEGMSALLSILKNVDPAYYQQADLQNPRRVLRALEVFSDTGIPYSAFRKSATNKNTQARNFKVIKLGLTRERTQLYERINERVESMIENGLLEEARSLHPYHDLNALQTVGYQELFPYFDHQYDLEEAVSLIKRNSRRYAKRQMTWFRKASNMQWFDITEKSKEQVLYEMITYIDNTIKNLSRRAQ